MDRNFLSGLLYFGEHLGLQRRLPPSARSVYEAAPGRIRRASATRLLLLSLGVWAASWATLASLSSWLK